MFGTNSLIDWTSAARHEETKLNSCQYLWIKLKNILHFVIHIITQKLYRVFHDLWHYCRRWFPRSW